jgi:hypothetical protein
MRYTIIKTQTTSMMSDSMFMETSAQSLASEDIRQRECEKENRQKNENQILHK